MLIKEGVDLSINGVLLGTGVAGRTEINGVWFVGTGVAGHSGKIGLEEIGVASVGGATIGVREGENGVAVVIGVIVFDGNFDTGKVGFTAGVEAFENLGHGVKTEKEGQGEDDNDRDDDQKLGEGKARVCFGG